MHFNSYIQTKPNSLYLPVGFDTVSAQKACCGIGGDYAFSIARMYGAPGVPVCSNPNKLISWDGVHLTQEAYKIMTG